MTTLAHGSMLGGPRNGGVAARRAVIRWAWRMFRREWRQQILVVTLLDRRRRGRNRQHHDRPQRGSRRRRRLRLGQPRAQLRQLRFAKAPGGTRVRQEVVRDDRRHRPPLGACPWKRRDGRLPITGSRRRLRRRVPRSPPRQLPGRPGTGRRDRRSGGVSSTRYRVNPVRSTGIAGRSWASSRTRAG